MTATGTKLPIRMSAFTSGLKGEADVPQTPEKRPGPNLTKVIAALAHPEHVRLRSAEAQKPWPNNGISVTFDTGSAPYNRTSVI